MTSCPEAMGWEFGDFEKDVSWDPTLGQANPAGGCEMRSTFVGSDSTVSIVKIVPLSSCRKTKVKKLINISYLNNGESSVFRISLPLYICIVVLWLWWEFLSLSKGSSQRILTPFNKVEEGLVLSNNLISAFITYESISVYIT